jgi:hypothetical protein
MGPYATLDGIYTSAPILDYDEDVEDTQAAPEEFYEGPGVATLAPEQFDAAILAALIAP